MTTDHSSHELKILAREKVRQKVPEIKLNRVAYTVFIALYGSTTQPVRFRVRVLRDPN